MDIDTRGLTLAIILGATSWSIKTVLPGIPVDFAIPGAKVDLGWAPAILAAIWVGVKGGIITGSFLSLTPIPTLYITGFLWTPWVLAAIGYLANQSKWHWKAALVFPLLHVPIGVAIFTWILPVFTFFNWTLVVPATLLTEYTSSIVAAIVARRLSTIAFVR